MQLTVFNWFYRLESCRRVCLDCCLREDKWLKYKKTGFCWSVFRTQFPILHYSFCFCSVFIYFFYTRKFLFLGKQPSLSYLTGDVCWAEKKKNSWFPPLGSVFIETGSGKKSESGYGQNLNRDQSCFLTLPGINIKLFFKNMLMSSSYDPASGSRRPLNPDPKP